MSSSEFSRIWRLLFAINETINIEVDKNGVKFYVNNENIKGGFILESNNSENIELQFKIEIDSVVNLAFAFIYICLLKLLLLDKKLIYFYLKNIHLWFNINWLN